MSASSTSIYYITIIYLYFLYFKCLRHLCALHIFMQSVLFLLMICGICEYTAKMSSYIQS